MLQEVGDRLEDRFGSAKTLDTLGSMQRDMLGILSKLAEPLSAGPGMVESPRRSPPQVDSAPHRQDEAPPKDGAHDLSLPVGGIVFSVHQGEWVRGEVTHQQRFLKNSIVMSPAVVVWEGVSSAKVSFGGVL